MDKSWMLWRKTIEHAADYMVSSFRNSITFMQLDYVELAKKSIPKLEDVGDEQISA